MQDGSQDDLEQPSGDCDGQFAAPRTLQQARFRQQFLKTQVCRFYEKGHCWNGEACSFAHGNTEVRHRPNLSKTSVCKWWMQGDCHLPSDRCQFAHGTWELRATSSYMKTTLCQAFLKGRCPLGETCRHAHSQEELQEPPLENQTLMLSDLSSSFNKGQIILDGVGSSSSSRSPGPISGVPKIGARTGQGRQRMMDFIGSNSEDGMTRRARSKGYPAGHPVGNAQSRYDPETDVTSWNSGVPGPMNHQVLDSAGGLWTEEPAVEKPWLAAELRRNWPQAHHVEAAMRDNRNLKVKELDGLRIQAQPNGATPFVCAPNIGLQMLPGAFGVRELSDKFPVGLTLSALARALDQHQQGQGQHELQPLLEGTATSASLAGREGRVWAEDQSRQCRQQQAGMMQDDAHSQQKLAHHQQQYHQQQKPRRQQQQLQPSTQADHGQVQSAGGFGSESEVHGIFQRSRSVNADQHAITAGERDQGLLQQWMMQQGADVSDKATSVPNLQNAARAWAEQQLKGGGQVAQSSMMPRASLHVTSFPSRQVDEVERRLLQAMPDHYDD